MLHSASNMRSIQVPPNVCICANLWVKVKLVDGCALVHKRFIVGTLITLGWASGEGWYLLSSYVMFSEIQICFKSNHIYFL